MGRYALHVGIAPEDDDTGPQLTELYEHVTDALSQNWFHTPDDVQVFLDGDDFKVWGEPLNDPNGYWHGVILFTIPDNANPWHTAVALYHDLITRPQPVVSLMASCWPQESPHVPFDLSDAEDWSVDIPKRA